MKEIVVSRHVDANPNKVFAVFSDFANAAQNVSGIDKLEILTAGPIGKGTRIRETRTLFGRQHSEEMEIVEYEPGRSYTLGCDSSGARHRRKYSISPEARGSFVRLHLTIEPLNFMGKVADLMLVPMRKKMTSLLERDLLDLRAAAEKKD